MSNALKLIKMSKKSRMQRARKRAKLAVEVKVSLCNCDIRIQANPKESKVVIKEETSKKARIHSLNYLVLWNNKDNTK